MHWLIFMLQILSILWAFIVQTATSLDISSNYFIYYWQLIQYEVDNLVNQMWQVGEISKAGDCGLIGDRINVKG